MAGETVLTIVGNLTADPELRATSGGVSVAGFTIAATPRVYDRRSQQWEDGQALFLRCSAWRELAEHCAASLSKGMRVIARGALRQRSYQANDGTQRTVIEMTVDEIGPSLRYAKAAVVRTTNPAPRANGFAPMRTEPAAPAPVAGEPAGAGGRAPVAEDDPWGAPVQSPFDDTDSEF
ncbi:single-stranded DNA-binding protein [Bifidobacterium phasiani]|uniref:Single-stranded DNA-binding protein n=1 Tax=Bifidobacterium phasiani TaxID=2834431 RepID=A0ABS6W752_9BIFI|nr:single-stranded DNA-binding protein [Bifidobacterium phasiani]MBW3081995.1 single-stranded DNA-binding protein [Bifidobacterium phasiani]